MQFYWLKTGCPTNIAPSSSYVDLHLASLDPSARYSINTNTAVACKPYWSQSEPPCTCPVSSDQELPSATPSNESACSDDSGIQNVSMSHSSNITVDIDKIMAKIDQDNRILAELDKTRSTIGKLKYINYESVHVFRDSLYFISYFSYSGKYDCGTIEKYQRNGYYTTSIVSKHVK